MTFIMKSALFGAMMFLTATSGVFAAESKVDLTAKEKQVFQEMKKEIPAEKIIRVEDFKKIVDEVNDGKRKAYILDLRSAPEFYTFHIEGADNIHAGHFYTIPRHIPDADAEIYIFCRTSHRAFYIAPYLQKFGYTNMKIVEGGILAWVKAGYPVVNQYMGKFTPKYEDFSKDYSPDYRETGKYRVREFHPY
ncbi:MAG: rhodanese-like domain-containing protein [Desulfuromonadaceae bacterium]|nr:rhodanese-like domain-containing protein [Desulfuromonadaceae bacterium]